MAVDPQARSSSSVVIVVGILFIVLLGGGIAMMALNRPEASRRELIDSAPAPPAADTPARSREFVVPPSASVQPGSVPPASSTATKR